MLFCRTHIENIQKKSSNKQLRRLPYYPKVVVDSVNCSPKKLQL